MSLCSPQGGKKITVALNLLHRQNYHISLLRHCGYNFFFAVCFSLATTQEWLLFEVFIGKATDSNDG